MSTDTQEQQTRLWGMFLHFSQLLGFLSAPAAFFVPVGRVVPILGIIVPIVIWQLKKGELPGIDAHGKNVVNWIISAFIYGIGCAVLTLFIVGVFLAIALMICAVVFAIIGGIKANNGEVWKYPLAISFIK